ncbi:MAG: hypothetical protein ACJAS1_002671 [Oleiphilaceae bacterium]|jgi:hypothetical protein
MSNFTNGPEAEVSMFYKEKFNAWYKYKRDIFFGFKDENCRKPCIIFTCGIKELTIGCQEAFLLNADQDGQSEVLSDFIEWVESSIKPSEPKNSRSSVTMMSNRRNSNQTSGVIKLKNPRLDNKGHIGDLYFDDDLPFDKC